MTFYSIRKREALRTAESLPVASAPFAVRRAAPFAERKATLVSAAALSPLTLFENLISSIGEFGIVRIRGFAFTFTFAIGG